MQQEKVTLEDIRECIVFGVKVAHVTFYLVKAWAEGYFVYSESNDRGLERILSDDPLIGAYPLSYDNAAHLLEKEIQRFEERLERKRSAKPSPSQLYYLFCNKVPIALDLTWGEAFDLIDDHKRHSQQIRVQRQAEKYDGFTVGQRITCQFYHPEHLEVGKIIKLTTHARKRFMHVLYDNGKLVRWPFTSLPKII